MEHNEGFNQLARALQKRMQTVSEPGVYLEFGEILADRSLRVNKYPEPFPQAEYFVCRQLTLGQTGEVLTQSQADGKPGDGTHDHGPSGEHGGHNGGSGTHTHQGEGPHVHDVLVPEKMRGVKPGDHVLVAWVDNDPVVVDVILPGTEIKA